MREMKKVSYIADLVTSLVAFVFAIALALFLHTKWYYGGWMDWFGDPPASNPAYERFVRLFEKAPYDAAGLTAGLIAGFGCPELMRILIRCVGIFVLTVIAFAHNSELANTDFVPPALGSFFISTCLSLVYFRLLGTRNAAK